MGCWFWGSFNGYLGRWGHSYFCFQIVSIASCTPHHTILPSLPPSTYFRDTTSSQIHLTRRREHIHPASLSHPEKRKVEFGFETPCLATYLPTHQLIISTALDLASTREICARSLFFGRTFGVD